MFIICIVILPNKMNFSKQILGSSLLLPAYGREGQGQHLLYCRRILRSKIRNSAAAEKSESESEGGQKFLPPNPLPFCPPERSVSAARSAAISRSFVQKRFELRSVIATKKQNKITLLKLKLLLQTRIFCVLFFSLNFKFF